MSLIIAANWKMNKVQSEAEATVKALREAIEKGGNKDRTVFVFPPFPSVKVCADILAGMPDVFVGAQNFYPAVNGAFTGEVSLEMIADCNANWVLIGHSERRHILHESDDFIAQKMKFAFEQGFGVMLCIGETLPEREAGQLEAVLARQLTTALKGLAVPKGKLIIAYEPVWAIGTGKVATNAEADAAHKVVKTELAKIDASLADLAVLYGGSVKPGNAAQLLALDNVDGLLVGGASLDAASFYSILMA